MGVALAVLASMRHEKRARSALTLALQETWNKSKTSAPPPRSLKEAQTPQIPSYGDHMAFDTGTLGL